MMAMEIVQEINKYIQKKFVMSRYSLYDTTVHTLSLEADTLHLIFLSVVCTDIFNLSSCNNRRANHPLKRVAINKNDV